MTAARQPIAVVTGAGTGVGQAVAQRLSEAGWSVALAGRRPGPLQETRAGLADPHRAWAIPTDVTDASSVDALFDAVQREAGRLDLLFNNAGSFGAPTPFDAYDPADWAQTLAVNVTGSFLCARRAFTQMRSQSPRGGRIINNGSLSAQVPRPQAAAYTTSKHAITGLTKAIALEGREHDIACGQIDIGNAATEMTGAIATGALQADGSRRGEPVIDAGAVADGVLYMASLPLEANVLSMTVMAAQMPFVGRG